MNFTKKHIAAKTLCIIDIGSYKLRVCWAKFKNKQVEILSYTEKRQDISYFANSECLNLPWLCENILEAISKLEQELELEFCDIVVNYPFGELFLGSKSINYKRDHPHTKITIAELEKIMQSVEKLCLKKLSLEVDRLYGLSPKEVQIILSRVNKISIDGKRHEKIIGQQWENMKISLLNAFIPSNKHKLISQIGNVLGKNIYKILPTEYCITKIFTQNNILIINVWATQTTLSLKYEGEVIAISKISIGINDLVNKIKKRTGDTRAQIIENLSSERYQNEKNNFLEIWGESIWITLRELLWKKVCPKNLYVWGGGGNNSFILEYLRKFNYQKHDIRILKDMTFIKEDMIHILKDMKNLKLEDIQRIPLDMYVLLMETNHLISKERDIVSSSLKTAIKNLGYIKS